MAKVKRVVRYTPRLLGQIRRLGITAKGGAVQERCGLIMKVSLGADLRFHEVPNVHADPVNHFAIAREDVRDLLATYELHSVLHTHISAVDVNPSPHDFEMLGNMRMMHPQVLGIVYVVHLGLLVEYSPDKVTRRTLLADREARLK